MAAGTLTFTPGDTSESISLSVVDDSLDEANETVIVTLSGPVNATLGANTTHTYTITDNVATAISSCWVEPKSRPAGERTRARFSSLMPFSRSQDMTDPARFDDATRPMYPAGVASAASTAGSS